MSTPLGVYLGAIVAVVLLMLVAPRVFMARHRERATSDPYESGMVPTGTARARISSHYYLVALLFVVFDLEAVFLFAWAVSARELGVAGLVEAALFVLVLLLGLAYLWRAGALTWSRGVR